MASLHAKREQATPAAAQGCPKESRSPRHPRKGANREQLPCKENGFARPLRKDAKRAQLPCRSLGPPRKDGCPGPAARPRAALVRREGSGRAGGRERGRERELLCQVLSEEATAVGRNVDDFHRRRGQMHGTRGGHGEREDELKHEHQSLTHAAWRWRLRQGPTQTSKRSSQTSLPGGGALELDDTTYSPTVCTRPMMGTGRIVLTMPAFTSEPLKAVAVYVPVADSYLRDTELEPPENVAGDVEKAVGEMPSPSVKVASIPRCRFTDGSAPTAAVTQFVPDLAYTPTSCSNRLSVPWNQTRIVKPPL